MLPSPQDWEITVEDASAVLAEGEMAIRLIDCREDDEFAYCRIEGAELLPLSRFAEECARRFLDAAEDERPVIVYCHHGMRSLSATHFLRQKGYRQVWSLRGGIDAWSKLIDPSVPRY